MKNTACTLFPPHHLASMIGTRAIRSVAAGKPFFSPAIADTLLEDYMRQLQQKGLQDSYDLLTDREKEILPLLAEGKSNKDIAAMLNLSINTVETHQRA